MKSNIEPGLNGLRGILDRLKVSIQALDSVGGYDTELSTAIDTITELIETRIHSLMEEEQI